MVMWSSRFSTLIPAAVDMFGQTGIHPQPFRYRQPGTQATVYFGQDYRDKLRRTMIHRLRDLWVHVSYSFICTLAYIYFNDASTPRHIARLQGLLTLPTYFRHLYLTSKYLKTYRTFVTWLSIALSALAKEPSSVDFLRILFGYYDNATGCEHLRSQFLTLVIVFNHLHQPPLRGFELMPTGFFASK